MHIILTSAIIINILAIVVLLIGLFYNFEQPKNKALYGYVMAGSLLLYIFLLSLVGIYGLVVEHNLYFALLFLCVISPFVIGKFVKYETLKRYTAAQIMCFIVSLVILLS